MIDDEEKQVEEEKKEEDEIEEEDVIDPEFDGDDTDLDEDEEPPME